MIDKLELLAIKSVALRDPEYFYRRVCRYYSQNFNTPLTEVHNLPWPFVFSNYLEHIVETNNDQESIYNLAIDICYPEKRVTEEEDLQRRIKEIEEEEAAKRQAKKEAHEKKLQEAKAKRDEEENDIVMDSSKFAHLDAEMEDENE